MDFEYIDYKTDIFFETIKDHPPRVYVFANHHDRYKAQLCYNQPFLQESSLFLTLSEFKDKLFPTDRLVLREQKLRVILYELLTDKEKDLFNISSYFDMVDLGSDFLSFYDQLHEYQVDQIKELREWQSDKLEIIEDLRDRYLNYMKKHGYTDSTIKFDFKNFNLHHFKNYNEIYFINIVDFTPRERDLLNRIERYGKKIRLYLQLNPGDFDEKNLRLRSVTLPEKVNTEIKVYHTTEDLLQLVNLFNIKENNVTEILDANFNNTNYESLLSSNQIKVDKEVSFSQTSIYKLIDRLYQLLRGVDLKEGKIRVKIEDLVKASRQSEFKEYYNITDQDFSALHRLAKDDYVYIEKDLINEELNTFTHILEELYELYQTRDLEKLIEFLTGLDIESLNDEQYKDNHTQYFDALAELKTLVDLDLISSWKNYFTQQSLGLLHLVLDYLEYKRVKKIRINNDPCLVIKDLFDAPHSNRNNLFILNANNKALPSVNISQFLLTEKQRINIGLPCTKKERIKQKYKFFRHVLNSKQTIIFCLENIEENLTSSSFVEELKIKYDIKSKECQIVENNYSQIMQSIFTNSEDDKFISINNENSINTPLLMEKRDFPDEGLPVSYYKYRCLKNCYYRFYLEHIAGLEEEWINFESKLDKKVLGIIVHEMFEDIIKELKEKIKQGILSPDQDKISKIISHKVNSFDLKIPNYFYSYYENVLLPRIRKSITEFFHILDRKIESQIIDVFTEWSHSRRNYFLEKDRSLFYLSGRIDLIIKTTNKLHLIDFKTGGENKEQLDFYSLLLEPELNESVEVEKYFYSVIDQKTRQRYRTNEKFKQKLSEILEDFIKQDRYIADYKSSCRKCLYYDICRVVVK